MSANFPTWVSTTEKENLFAQAEALGASLAVLSSENSTQTFVNTKLKQAALAPPPILSLYVAVRMNFTLYNVNPVADQFSTVGGVHQYLTTEATVNNLVGFCRRTIRNSISGVAEGSLDNINSFRDKMMVLQNNGMIEFFNPSIHAVLEISFANFCILKNQSRHAIKGPDSDQDENFEKVSVSHVSAASDEM